MILPRDKKLTDEKGNITQVWLDALRKLDGSGSGGMGDGYWTILTNGNLTTPEVIFAGGDVVSIFVPT